jgi:uncharacterized small protein (DUF1192 family)
MSGKAKIEAKAAAGEEITVADIDEQIAAIRQRIKRTEEISYENTQKEAMDTLLAKRPKGNLLP